VIGFVDASGRPVRFALEDACDIRFEEALTVRSLPSYKGQRNFPGVWCSSTMGCHICFE
jgi:hypothetical protein